MKRKKIGGYIALIAVAIIGVVIAAYFLVKPTYQIRFRQRISCAFP